MNVYPLHAFTKRAATYRGVSDNIIWEKIDVFYFQVIRREMEISYLNKNRILTLQTLLTILKEKFDVPLLKSSPHNLFYDREFIWKKRQNKRQILIGQVFNERKNGNRGYS